MNNLPIQNEPVASSKNVVIALVASGLLMALAFVAIWYYMSMSSDTANEAPVTEGTALTEEQARLLHEQLFASTTAPLPQSDRNNLTTQIMFERTESSMSEDDAALLREQIFQ